MYPAETLAVAVDPQIVVAAGLQRRRRPVEIHPSIEQIAECALEGSRLRRRRSRSESCPRSRNGGPRVTCCVQAIGRSHAPRFSTVSSIRTSLPASDTPASHRHRDMRHFTAQMIAPPRSAISHGSTEASPWTVMPGGGFGLRRPAEQVQAEVVPHDPGQQLLSALPPYSGVTGGIVGERFYGRPRRRPEWIHAAGFVEDFGDVPAFHQHCETDGRLFSSLNGSAIAITSFGHLGSNPLCAEAAVIRWILPRIFSSVSGGRLNWPQVYVGVALTTLATLVLEFSLTRIFSVVFYYHFAFLAISIALFGLGAGGVLSYLVGVKGPEVYRRIGMLACGDQCHDRAGTLVFLLTRGEPTSLTLGDHLFVSAAPFAMAGMIVSLAISETIERVDRVYFFDLMGAAGGCLVLVPFLNRLRRAEYCHRCGRYCSPPPRRSGSTSAEAPAAARPRSPLRWYWSRWLSSTCAGR